MKKIFSIITLFFLLTTNKTFAVSYKDDIILDLYPSITNSQTNINGAKLIEKYLINLKYEIQTFNEKYDITGDVETDEFLIKIDKMISSLRKIQTISLEKSTAEDVMRSIINELKTFNPKIKSYLKKKKIAVQIQTTNTKNNYVVFSQKLSKSLSKLINDFYSMNISKNKNEIEIHLKNLKNYNNRLLSFRDLKFNNPSGVKSKFIQILNNIKNEIIEIKKLLK
ncbi:MAG: hypothetical protein WC850_03885 [Candidatus Gracilibacteria bacterium]